MTTFPVIPAKAGIQRAASAAHISLATVQPETPFDLYARYRSQLDSRLRGNDACKVKI
jgi:hypothetical protein